MSNKRLTNSRMLPEQEAAKVPTVLGYEKSFRLESVKSIRIWMQQPEWYEVLPEAMA